MVVGFEIIVGAAALFLVGRFVARRFRSTRGDEPVEMAGAGVRNPNPPHSRSGAIALDPEDDD